MIGPRDATQNFVFDVGKVCIWLVGIAQVLGVSRPQNTVCYDKIVIGFPSFLINSPEVKIK